MTLLIIKDKPYKKGKNTKIEKHGNYYQLLIKSHYDLSYYIYFEDKSLIKVKNEEKVFLNSVNNLKISKI